MESIFDFDFIELSVIYAKSFATTRLFNDDNRRRPIAIGVLNYFHLQHLLNRFIYITFSFAKRVLYGFCDIGVLSFNLIPCCPYYLSICPRSESFLENFMWYSLIKSRNFFFVPLINDFRTLSIPWLQNALLSYYAAGGFTVFFIRYEIEHLFFTS